MNAARPIFSGAFSPASLTPTSAVPASASAAPAALPVAPASRAKARLKARRIQRAPKNKAPESAPSDEYSSCLAQARICRDQAQEAARLRRFQSAVGLFQTAISLCQRAVSLRKSPAPLSAPHPEGCDAEAHEYIQVLTTEMSAYDELARSMNRPLVEAR